MPPLNPNHHLWRNGRLWWIAFTVIHDGWRQERIRRSLGTADLEEARRRRDILLAQITAVPNARRCLAHQHEQRHIRADAADHADNPKEHEPTAEEGLRGQISAG